MPNLITEGGGEGGLETDKKWLRNMWTAPYNDVVYSRNTALKVLMILIMLFNAVC